MNKDTARCVMEIVREEYLSLERRQGLLISKTQTLSTVAAIISTVISAGLFSEAKANFNASLMYVALACSWLGLFISLGVLMSQSFRKIRYEPALDDGELEKEMEIIAVNFSKTYHEAIINCERTLDRLTTVFDYAIKAFMMSLVFVALSIFFGPIMECNSMSEKKQDQQPQQPSTQKPANNMPQTTSYGTDVIKKSEDVPSGKLQGNTNGKSK